MVAGPTSPDPYDALAKRITDLENAVAEQGRRAIPDADIPLFPLFVPTAPAAGIGASPWAITSNAATSETDMWSGRIGEVWHPTIAIDGFWGFASGSGTATFRLRLDGTLIGSWSYSTGQAEQIIWGPFDCSAFLRQRNVGVTLTLQCSLANSSQIWIAPLGCQQRRRTD